MKYKITLIVIIIYNVLLRISTVIRYKPILHEYDPYFNYKVTDYLIKNSSLKNWHDKNVWYPYGRNILNTCFPGMMYMSYMIFKLLEIVKITISTYNLCFYFPIIGSIFTIIIQYVLTYEIFECKNIAILSAFLLAGCPAFLNRSMAGFYDYECIAIALILLCFYFYLKKKLVPLILSYFVLASTWGGYVFVINLISLHTILYHCFKLIYKHFFENINTYKKIKNKENIITEEKKQITFDTSKISVGEKNYSHTLDKNQLKNIDVCEMNDKIINFNKKIVNSTAKRINLDFNNIKNKLNDFIKNLYQNIQIKFQYLINAENSLQFYTLFYILGNLLISLIPIIGKKSFISQEQIIPFTVFLFNFFTIKARKRYKLLGFSILLCLIPIFLNKGRLLNLVFFKRSKSALIDSISEHFPSSFYKNLRNFHFMILLIPISIKYLKIKNLFNFLFIFLYLSISVFLLCKMIRLAVIAAPCFCMVVSNTLIYFERKNQSKLHKLIAAIFLSSYFLHSIFMSYNYFAIPNIIVLSEDDYLMDDFHEAYNFLKEKNDVVLAWWDYGYQLNALTNVKTLADNNTSKWNRIKDIAIILLSDEKKAFDLCKKENIKYIFIVSGNDSGYQHGYLNKEYWIRKIAEEDGEKLNDLKESIMYLMSYEKELKFFNLKFKSESGIVFIYEVISNIKE
ncbi:hypothetical protein GVAV_003148 [Gurleya vavrai]